MEIKTIENTDIQVRCADKTQEALVSWVSSMVNILREWKGYQNIASTHLSNYLTFFQTMGMIDHTITLTEEGWKYANEETIHPYKEANND